MATCRWLTELDFDITYIKPDENGVIDPIDVERALRAETILVSVMLANNETGVVQPIDKITQIAKQQGALFHCDAVQGAGKVGIDVKELGVDLLTLSAHKLHGPKGMGALYLRHGVDIVPLIHGGNQENGLRAGTENVAGPVGFGTAAELAIKRTPQMKTVTQLRDHLEKGVSLSSGSACRSGSPKPYYALLAMGMVDKPKPYLNNQTSNTPFMLTTYNANWICIVMNGQQSDIKDRLMH